MTMNETKTIEVLGAGESGVGAAILAADRGYEVYVSDSGAIAEKYRRMLEAEGIHYQEYGHAIERILGADIVVKSPGIPDTAPVVEAVRRAGIPVLSEIEFAGRFSRSFMICITGSNGKTTTTMLTHHILRAAGIDASLAGNIGKSLALQVARDPHDVYVIELSSFQLDNMYDFRADIAVLMNITPDHLDRYDHRMENYVAAKFRILQNMGPEQQFIYWKDDPVIASWLAAHPADVTALPFAEHEEPGAASYVDAEGIMHIGSDKDAFTMPRAELSLKGVHNLYNSMAAATVGRLMGVKPELMRRALSDFGGVEHRLEYVCDVDGVRYINDSKATNVASTYYALGSMTAPTVLILGGKDKGNDYSEIDALVDEHVHTIVAMGVDNAKIVAHFGPRIRVIDTHSLDEALKACREAARPGDTVLLSPCCASFDLFRSYEDRGERFKAGVRAMAGKEEA